MAYCELRFRALSDPGWHPEYGFQLTFAGIAIDEDGTAGTGRTTIPYNSNYSLSGERGYEKLVVVGGGVRIEDAGGKILAAYVPGEEDAQRPFAVADSGVIRFALPLRYLGTPGKWRYTIIAGGQDDHGGAGIGEFRTVNPDQGEWNGGGRMSSTESNIYDDLETR
jgi:carbohydrate-binding DOMON domain-containing protein